MVKLANTETAAQKKATRAAYGATLAELAAEGVPVVAVDADLTGSTTTKKLADAGFADRLFNCGIAEQNMFGIAAGLAKAGLIPFASTMAIFACMRNANVYMDISEYERSPQGEAYVKAMCTTISDKVLFASAHPFIELRDALDAYAAFPFTDEVRNKIMYENARKVLKLA